MGLLEALLKKTFGKVHIMVTVGSKPAIEVIFEDNEIILDIKNPVLAMEAGLDQMLTRRKEFTTSSKRLEGLKKMGYKIKIKYKNLEYEL